MPHGSPKVQIPASSGAIPGRVENKHVSGHPSIPRFKQGHSALTVLFVLFILPHNISFAQKILQLKTTDLEPLTLITFHIYAFHKTKSTTLLKDYIVHFL